MPTPQVASPEAALGPHAAVLDEIAVECRLKVAAWSLSPRTAARRTRDLLRSQVVDHVTDQTIINDLEVMVCELTTNALRHAAGPREMRLPYHADIPVVCEIADTGDGLDEIAQHLRRHSCSTDTEQIMDVDALQVGGRGLGIVAHLSGGRCGAHTTRLCSTGQPGKSVWFAIPTEQGEAP